MIILQDNEFFEIEIAKMISDLDPQKDRVCKTDDQNDRNLNQLPILFLLNLYMKVKAMFRRIFKRAFETLSK